MATRHLTLSNGRAWAESLEEKPCLQPDINLSGLRDHDLALVLLLT
jgi:hypothetical protein